MVKPVLPEPDWIVGKHGLLNIHARLQNGRTEIESKGRRSPFQWEGYHYQDYDDEPFFPLITTTGGFVEGDVTEFHATLDPNTRMLVTGTSASKFYKCLEGKPSREIVNVTVGPRALFEYHASEAIPFGRSCVQRHTRVVMDLSSRLFAIDLISAGRVHYGEGEIFKFDSLVSVFEVVADNRRLALDRLIATERQDIDALKRLWNGAYYMGVVFAYAPDLPKEVEDSVHDNCEGIDGTETGVSRIGNMVVVRILSHEAWQARKAIYRVWEAVRPAIAGKPAGLIKTGSSPTGLP
ncbi:Urease accessory protein UreD [subsurface metagenome]